MNFELGRISEALGLTANRQCGGLGGRNVVDIETGAMAGQYPVYGDQRSCPEQCPGLTNRNVTIYGGASITLAVSWQQCPTTDERGNTAVTIAHTNNQSQV